MCNECCKRNQQGDGWRLKARHYTHRQYPPPYGVLLKGDNRLEIAIKAARIRMPWQKALGFEWVPGPWMESEVGISPIELCVKDLAFIEMMDDYQKRNLSHV